MEQWQQMRTEKNKREQKKQDETKQSNKGSKIADSGRKKSEPFKIPEKPSLNGRHGNFVLDSNNTMQKTTPIQAFNEKRL